MSKPILQTGSPQLDRIHLQNGTYFLDGRGFVPEKKLCLNRLPVEYQPDAPAPTQWLEFLDGLLIPKDILTLQEYLGYLLIPSAKAQKILVMVDDAKWCEDALESPVTQKKFGQFLRKNSGRYGLTFTKHIEGKFALVKRSETMKSPVGTLSDRMVSPQARWRGLAPTSSHFVQ